VKRERATISDVARLAGVAPSTVSAVLNGTARVSPQKTARVARATRALDYRPNKLGRSLRFGRSRVIGIVVPDITNPFYPEMFRDIEKAATEKGYSVILCDSANDPKRERNHLETLYARRVDGVLVACADSRTSYDWLASRDFPIVFFERIPFAGQFAAVSTDHKGAAKLATEHFISLGHTRIAFLITRLSLSSNSARLEGFRQAMQERAIPVRSDYLLTQLRGVEGGYKSGLRLLDLAERPTAILCSNSALLLGLVRALGERGVHCPAEISLMGFDHTMWTENFTPPLTTLAQPTSAIAHQAIRLLLSRIEREAGSEHGQSSMVLLNDELCVRGSTGPAPERSTAIPARTDKSGGPETIGK